MIFRRQRDDSRSLDIGERITKIDYRIDVLNGGRGKGGVEFFGRGRLNYQQNYTEYTEPTSQAGYLFRQVMPCALGCRD